MVVPQKLNIELPFHLAIAPVGRYTKDLKAGTPRVTCTPVFIAASFTVAKRWKQTKCLSTDDG